MLTQQIQHTEYPEKAVNHFRKGLHKPINVYVRSSPGAYISILFSLTIAAAYFFYLEQFIPGALLLGFAWIILPVLALTDRIRFDGRRISRTGLLPRLWNYLNRSRNGLRLSDIEQVDTQALRGIKRGGRVRYRFKTTFRGRGIAISIFSGGRSYRRMIHMILPRLDRDVLDNRSIELAEYLSDADEAALRARTSKIPSGEVLEETIQDIIVKKRQSSVPIHESLTMPDLQKAATLRKLANELRLSGALLQAIEAFRRAVLLSPRDAWLLFEFARCLESLAGSERNERLYRRAVAMMRLAERRAGDDGELLARLGEAYFQVGDWRRAAVVFKRVIEKVGASFRALRGLAEVALREGKIAHVIHNFAAANSLAPTRALRRWTRGEVEYFSRLNEDDEYMELEVSRVNLLDSLERVKSGAMKAAVAGFPLIAIGMLLEENLIANSGWAISLGSVGVWLVVLLGRRILESRIPFDLIDKE